MVSPIDGGGGGGGTGSDSGVTSPSPPTTSRQEEGDERIDDDHHDVSVLPDQLPPPSDASTPLKVDCNRPVPHSSSSPTQPERRSHRNSEDDDVDNELGEYFMLQICHLHCA